MTVKDQFRPLGQRLAANDSDIAMALAVIVLIAFVAWWVS